MTSVFVMRLQLRYFNSIKVRLIQYGSPQSHKKNEFQFHKGSINTKRSANMKMQFWLFQFHKGSINTLLELNSIKWDFHFNSIKVRLILKDFLRVEGKNDDFNSIKVRLILRGAVWCHGFPVFQFHKGSINTSLFAALSSLSSISIP